MIETVRSRAYAGSCAAVRCFVELFACAASLTFTQWYCATCMADDSTLEVTLKPGARKSSRPKSAINYSNFHKGARAPC